jgi:membrane protease YdiL (CAAX protease family)
LLPFLQLLGAAVDLVLGKEIYWQSNQMGGRLELAGMVIFVFLYQFFYANCLGEEIGWRGFALLKLQARYSPLFSSLIIVFFWVPWHFPFWQSEGKAIFNLEFLLHTYMLYLAYAVIFAWLYNHSSRSIIVAGLTHASSNVGWHFLPKTDAFEILVVGITIIIIVVDLLIIEMHMALSV